MDRTQAEIGTAYVKERQIPELFQSLMIGLMHVTPHEPVDFLISCLAQVKHVTANQEVVSLSKAYAWKQFVPRRLRKRRSKGTATDARNDIPNAAATALPAVSGGKSPSKLPPIRSTPASKSKGGDKRKDNTGSIDPDPAATAPLPPIGSIDAQPATVPGPGAVAGGFVTDPANITAVQSQPSSEPIELSDPAVLQRIVEHVVSRAEVDGMRAAAADLAIDHDPAVPDDPSAQQHDADAAVGVGPGASGGAGGVPSLVICGPSGVGKSSLVDKLMAEFPGELGFSVSHTSREPREGEEDGTHYHFASKTNIGVLIASGDMLEHAEVHGNIYGTSRAAFEAVSGAGTVCVLDVDTQGVRSLKKAGVQPPPYYVFVKPPSMDAIKTRLEKRGTETADSLATRLATVQSELDFADAGGHFDAVIVNDDLEVAYALLRGLYLEHLAGRPGLSPPPPPPPQDEGAGAGEGGAFAYFDEPGGNVVFAFGGPGSGRESTARKAAEAAGMEWVVLDANQPTRKALQQLDGLIETVPSYRGVMVDGLRIGHDFYEQLEHHTGRRSGAATGCSSALFFDLPAAAVEERVRKTGGDATAVAEGAARFAAAVEAEVHAMTSFVAHGRGFTIDATDDADAMLTQAVEALAKIGFSSGAAAARKASMAATPAQKAPQSDDAAGNDGAAPVPDEATDGANGMAAVPEAAEPAETDATAALAEDTAADLADLADPVDPGVVAVPEPNGAANVVCVLGGPGAGKSTQCNKALAAGVNMEFYSVGDLLRAEVKSGSEKGQLMQALMSQGSLVPMETIIEVIKPVLAAVPADKGVLLDGFPRAIDQHELFERLVGKARAVLWYELPQEVMETRLLKRAEASGRADDKADVIRKRFATFVAESKPVLEIFEASGRAEVIDASGDADTVFVATMAALKRIGYTPTAAPAVSTAPEVAAAPADDESGSESAPAVTVAGPAAPAEQGDSAAAAAADPAAAAPAPAPEPIAEEEAKPKSSL